MNNATRVALWTATALATTAGIVAWAVASVSAPVPTAPRAPVVAPVAPVPAVDNIPPVWCEDSALLNWCVVELDPNGSGTEILFYHGTDGSIISLVQTPSQDAPERIAS